MREIKFRGKDCSGQWVYGDLIHKRHDKESVLIQDERGLGSDVDTTTIGQYTGLKDAADKEIYEGDIIRIPETEFNIEIIGVVEFDRGSYFIRSFFSGTHSNLEWAVRERQLGEQRGVVIGNIHDNPELIKEEK